MMHPKLVGCICIVYKIYKYDYTIATTKKMLYRMRARCHGI